MNFEKVELYGFKSFADKAEIKFGDGITGIVGPNGCGKSNVADAIRWVLGEQSAKSLRGTNMQDVIFSGTQDRKSLSYCEVSLYFDNSSKMFDIDYNEVIITRKLFRSGESEYYINKQPARLKDIVDLLHECGVGKEGYTVIGQGKVEEIMSAKPEDRRAIFEEATGIAKFKSRKNESERKLERTRDNLTRYSDILSEIENQLAPLKKQEEKTKEYNDLTAELKRHELNTYVAKADGVATAKEKINTRIKGLNEQTALRESELSAVQAEYDRVLSEINSADEKLKNYNEEMLERRVGMEKNSGAKQLFEQKISFLTGQIERTENEIKANIALIENCRATGAELSEDIDAKKEQLKTLSKKADELSRKILTLSEKISLGEELASANRKKVIDSLKNLTDLKVNKGEMSIEIKSLSEKKDELTLRLDELSVRREKIFNDKDNCDKNVNALDRAVSDLKNKILEQENEVRSLNEQSAAAENKIYSLNTVVTALITKDNFYKSMKENYEGYAPSVKILLNNAKTNSELKKRIKGVVAELIGCDKKYDVAIETALAAAAQNVVTETPDDARYLIDYLKANKLGRTTFLPVSSVKPRNPNPEFSSALKEKGALGAADALVSYDAQFENVISNLLGNTLVADTLENATAIAKRHNFSFKIVDLDGDVLSTQGAMTGGFKRQDAGILSGDRKIEENAAMLANKSAEMDKLKAEKAEIFSKRDKSLEDLSILNEMYNDKRRQTVVEREKLTVSENSLSELGREIESVSDLIDEVKNRMDKLGEDFKNVSSGDMALEGEKTDAETAADRHQAEFDALKAEREKLLADNTAIQVESTGLKAAIASAEEEKSRLSSSAEDAEKNNVRLTESINGAAAIIENLRRDEEKVALSKEEQDEINRLRENIQTIEDRKVSLRDNLAKSDEKKQNLSEQISALAEKKHSEEIALAKIDSDLEYLGQSIFEDYQETYESASKVREENYDATFGEQEIARIRRRRSALGAINASAIEDYKLMKERYDEMTVNKQDMEKAEADLLSAIDKIRGEMLTQFNAGFEKINVNFQKIFKELFGGGKAMLELDYTGADDKLEAGVEIIAEPPGKKLQKLSLLSGGEKALTAIAILFSILKMRPMPFCVLDEIEAALDEANVDRFANYLQKFSEETQFIVITHRKPTMEKADALFGVTMQEKGVSKTVSVKLSDVAEMDDQLA